ncbi:MULTISPECIES: RagB/SusD family nutrient uptake outer membrane protein [unclassified Flavobacterium]|jgi:hypothetical protein|uniref:RagB/SusD family nutrient uptake outer membrane protein n=1 Tax=unclassified Flavobacterium TaxID=196869 RepID=UPI0025BD9FEE|nr:MULTISPECIES: RagB/SusD family nutrient uptake outer membrane protein [unclassified Flavobacterium]
MKNIRIIILLVFLGTFVSCNDNFLEVAPSDRYSDAAVWNDPVLIRSFVNEIYIGLPHGFSNVAFASLSDDALDTWSFESDPVLNSQLNPGYLAIMGPNHWNASFKNISWPSLYKEVRACNVFLGNMANSKLAGSDIDQLKGEVLYLRAHYYTILVSLYGGVPLIDKALTSNDDLLTPRSTFDDCIKFIVKDLDGAAALLPLNGDKARATKGAALGLKSRILLYAASDLFNSNGAWTSGYSKNELIGYTGGDRTARWQAAKDAAKAVIDLGIYNLYGGTNPGSPEAATNNYINIFLNNGNVEDIFLSYQDNVHNTNWDSPSVGLFDGPNGYHNWGGNSPLGQLVDSYEMIDGTKFDWNNTTHNTAPYVNRDPRFYANILYDGAKWRQRPADVRAADPLGIIQTGKYQQANGTFVAGLDTRQSPIEDWNGSYTGYYTRKFIDPSIDHQYVKQKLPWRQIRYAEILLNYAEACLGLGQEVEAKQYMNLIRSRAGMPNVPVGETGQTLVNRYRNERRIELSYELQRYFDIRRWMIAPTAIANAQGVSIVHPFGSANTTYSVIEVRNRAWINKSYLLPIMQEEMNRNKNLIQNPGY